MTPITINKGKIKNFLPSEQVKEILNQRGFLKIFNYTDYNHYKEIAKDSFNRVMTIAELFIEDYTTTNQSDFADYIF